jgi:hypothetical protein
VSSVYKIVVAMGVIRLKCDLNLCDFGLIVYFAVICLKSDVKYEVLQVEVRPIIKIQKVK